MRNHYKLIPQIMGTGYFVNTLQGPLTHRETLHEGLFYFTSPTAYMTSHILQAPSSDSAGHLQITICIKGIAAEQQNVHVDTHSKVIVV